MTFQKTIVGTIATLKIEGALDALSTPDLRPTIDALITDGVSKVTVDLSSLRLIDSSGVGALISLYKRLRARGGDMTIAGIKDQPLAIFKLLRLERMLTPAGSAA
jgi:anti-sigma B factor antagonist